MPRELITIQVGQCGNQVGRAFWLRALSEHARHSSGVFDEPISSFFRNVDARVEPARELPLGSPLASLRARALLVDMEEGPVSEMLRSDIGELFDSQQTITDVSGSGNNFAHGFGFYGPRYGREIMDQARRALEACDSPQSFLLLHSLGGGTGSGLGSYILGELEDSFPEIYRLDCCVVPSADDDVVTSPYNALLGLCQLSEHADAVLPLENGALAGIVERYGPKDGDKQQGFARMNDIAGRVISDLTSSMRFPGDLNVDLNEVTTNLVPFPRMQFLMCSLSPFGGKAPSKGRGRSSRSVDAAMQRPRSVREIFQDVLQPYHQLVQEDIRSSRMLACGLFARGPITISDFNVHVKTLQKQLRFPYWNVEGFKVGQCSVPSLDSPQSLLCLSNSCAIRSPLQRMRDRFDTLWKRKAMVHHYDQYMDRESFVHAANAIDDIIQLYSDMERGVQDHESADVPLFKAAF